MLVYCAEDPRFKTHLELRVGCSLTVHLTANGDLVEHWGDKGGKEGTDHPTSQSRWPRTSVLSNRQSPTYGSYMEIYIYLE